MADVVPVVRLRCPVPECEQGDSSRWTTFAALRQHLRDQHTVPDLVAEIDRLTTELARARPVLDAAEAMADDWRDSSPHGHVRRIIAAVDSYRSVST